MSHTQKPKSFYKDQAAKKMQADPTMRKWYEDVIKGRDSYAGMTEEIRKHRKKGGAPKSIRPSKPCAQCGTVFEKLPGSGADHWNKRETCSRTCTLLLAKNEAMQNLSKSNQ